MSEDNIYEDIEDDEVCSDGCGINKASPAEWEAAFNTLRGKNPIDDGRDLERTDDRVAEEIDPLSKQVEGNHYRQGSIQPIEYIMANSLPFSEGNIVKYVTRWRNKGGIKDLEKAKHYLEFLIAEEESLIEDERKYERDNGIY